MNIHQFVFYVPRIIIRVTVQNCIIAKILDVRNMMHFKFIVLAHYIMSGCDRSDTISNSDILILQDHLTLTNGYLRNLGISGGSLYL